MKQISGVIKVTRIDDSVNYYEGWFNNNGELEYSRMGGGFNMKKLQYDSLKKIEFLSSYDSVWKPSKVSLLDGEIKMKCYLTEGNLWNGWACPAMTKDQVIEYLKWNDKVLAENPDCGMYKYWWEGETLVSLPHEDDDPIAYNIEPFDSPFGMLYDMSQGFTWEIDHELEEAEV